MLKNIRNLSRTSRKPFSFGRQVVLLAFGIIGFGAAFAWNIALSTWIQNTFMKPGMEVLVYFLYAIVFTVIAIFLIWILVKVCDWWEI